MGVIAWWSHWVAGWVFYLVQTSCFPPAWRWLDTTPGPVDEDTHAPLNSTERNCAAIDVWVMGYLVQLQLNHPLCIHIPQSKVYIWVTGSSGRPLGAAGLHLHQGDHCHQLLQPMVTTKSPKWLTCLIKSIKCTSHNIKIACWYRYKSEVQSVFDLGGKRNSSPSSSVWARRLLLTSMNA